MSKQVVAIYPGTFDPISLGHEDIVLRAAASEMSYPALAQWLRRRGVVAQGTHQQDMRELDDRISQAFAPIDLSTTLPIVTGYAGCEGGMVRLDPANSAYDPQFYPPGEVQVQGKLAGLLRRYH